MPWKRSAIAAGFIANSYLFGNSMTPGKSRLFWPSEEYKNTPTEYGSSPKPWIALSGDDDGIHYLLFPRSEDPADMEYELRVGGLMGLHCVQYLYHLDHARLGSHNFRHHGH